MSPNCRIRYPDFFRVGDHSIIDDYCYFSTTVEIGRSVHIGAGCVVAGGKDRVFRMEDFSGLAAGAKLYCKSDDFVHDLSGLPPVADLQTHALVGNVTLRQCAVVGANSVVMPDNELLEGVAIGALSFVPPRFRFEPWTVYSGHPIRKIIPRDKKNVLAQVEAIKKQLGW